MLKEKYLLASLPSRPRKGQPYSTPPVTKSSYIGWHEVHLLFAENHFFLIDYLADESLYSTCFTSMTNICWNRWLYRGSRSTSPAISVRHSSADVRNIFSGKNFVNSALGKYTGPRGTRGAEIEKGATRITLREQTENKNTNIEGFVYRQRVSMHRHENVKMWKTWNGSNRGRLYE